MSKQTKRPAYAISKRRRFTVFTFCLLLVAAFVWFDHCPLRCSWQDQSKSGEQAKAYDFEKYHKKTFTVIKVVDGDTININIPDGDDDYTRIRLWGVDTPETKHPEKGIMYFGTEAADFATNLALGKKVTVYLEEHHTRGKFGKLLAYVQLPDGRFLNEVLLIEGFAYADLRFRHSFYHKYKQLEASARSRKKGLWKEVRREQLPEWLQRRKPNLLLVK